MARNSYRMIFRDKEIIYSKLGLEHTSVPVRFIEEYQLELMNLMLGDLKEVHFSCSEEEFHSRLVPTTLERFKELKSNEFSLVT